MLSDWTFDPTTGVYVIHKERKVMYSMNDQWIYGDYDAIYNNDRYMYDEATQTWFDTITHTYSTYDASTQSYIPAESTQSIRFVVLSSPHFNTGQVVIVDENGMTIGRDRSWDGRLRLPELMVSKYHAMVFLDKSKHQFFLVDNGSQHGTFINDTRLSDPKQSSLPHALHHLDKVRIGSTVLEVHEHTALPCPSCATQDPIDIHAGKKPKHALPVTTTTRADWLKEAKKLYPALPLDNTNYIDRAKLRRETTLPEPPLHHRRLQEERLQEERRQERMTRRQEETTHPTVGGIGNQLLQKLGWKEGQGLGKDQTGILEPIQPIQRTSRSGLGSRH